VSEALKAPKRAVVVKEKLNVLACAKGAENNKARSAKTHSGLVVLRGDRSMLIMALNPVSFGLLSSDDI
jgi:hypothetical protein